MAGFDPPSMLLDDAVELSIAPSLELEGRFPLEAGMTDEEDAVELSAGMTDEDDELLRASLLLELSCVEVELDEDDSICGIGGSQILSPEHAANAAIPTTANPVAIFLRKLFNSQTINQTFLCCKLFCVRIFRVDASD